MAHNLDRLRHAAVDALVRTANAAPNKRLGNIFLIINFTHICQVISLSWRPRSTSRVMLTWHDHDTLSSYAIQGFGSA